MSGGLPFTTFLHLELKPEEAMFRIQNNLVDPSIATVKFACDLSKCRGACCTMPGGRGAPLEENEVEHVRKAERAAAPWLSGEKRHIIRQHGSVEGKPGDRSTRCVDDRDCVFVYYEGEIAKCAMERAWLEGESSFRKPLSCHLFPIRVDELFGGSRLRYEQIDECEPALERGERGNISLVEFLKEPLVRAFGEEFYEELLATSQQQ